MRKHFYFLFLNFFKLPYSKTDLFLGVCISMYRFMYQPIQSGNRIVLSPTALIPLWQFLGFRLRASFPEVISQACFLFGSVSSLCSVLQKESVSCSRSVSVSLLFFTLYLLACWKAAAEGNISCAFTWRSPAVSLFSH